MSEDGVQQDNFPLVVADLRVGDQVLFIEGFRCCGYRLVVFVGEASDLVGVDGCPGGHDVGGVQHDSSLDACDGFGVRPAFRERDDLGLRGGVSIGVSSVSPVESSQGCRYELLDLGREVGIGFQQSFLSVGVSLPVSHAVQEQRYFGCPVGRDGGRSPCEADDFHVVILPVFSLLSAAIGCYPPDEGLGLGGVRRELCDDRPFDAVSDVLSFLIGSRLSDPIVELLVVGQDRGKFGDGGRECEGW